MPVLLPWQRNQAIDMLEAGVSQSEVARRFNCHNTTIGRLQRRYQQTGTTDARLRSGRPLVTTNTSEPCTSETDPDDTQHS